MMSWRLKIRSQQPIGLDIGHNSIKMIQLSVSDGRISVIAADKVHIDPNINGDAEERRSFVVSAVKQMLAGGSFRGKSVISCLPNDNLKITSLRLAETQTPKETEQILKKEAAQRFGLDGDEDAINYTPAGSVKHGDEIKNEYILFATDNDAIKSHIAMLEEIGLRPAAIDTIPCALFRGFEKSLKRQDDMDRTVVFIDVGSRFTTVVFGRGCEISFVKQIPIGGEKFNRQIATKLGISIGEAQRLRDTLRMEKAMNSEKGPGDADPNLKGQSSLDVSTRQVMVDAVGAVSEELAREISLCFRYYTVTFRGKRVERAIIAGGGACENILLTVLKRQLTVEIEVAQPFRGIDMKNVNFDSDRRGLLCEWAVAVGIGLKGWNNN
ncbi:MAG: pilus assembly protein PilM [Planctomycetota bacterium]|jgi:type IV pilus assembly protein PilM